MPLPNYPANPDFLIATFSRINLDNPDATPVITETEGVLTEFSGFAGTMIPPVTGLTMTYAFATVENAGLELIEQDASLFREMAEHLRQIIRDTLNELSKILDITFVEVESGQGQTGDRHFEIAGTGGAGGQFIPNLDPDTGNELDTGGFVHLGIADFATDDTRSSLLADDEQFNDGTFPEFKYVFMHEFGHALGLRHPVSDNVVETYFELTGEQVEASFFQSVTLLPDEFNTLQYTVMGATFVGFSQTPILRQLEVRNDTVYTTSDTLGILDILALQRLYGANTSVTAGNDIYTFKSEQAVYQTVYDADGVDTFSFQNQTMGVVADIRSGAFSSVGLLETNPGGNSPGGTTIVQAQNNIAVAFNTIIENVVGSDFADDIRGNEISNELIGNAGNDTLQGGAGADILEGGEGVDTASYADSASAITGNLNSGIFARGDAAGDSVSGVENLIGSSFADRLVGDANANVLYGGAGGDTLSGGGGGDTIDGGKGNDTFFAGAGDTGDDLYVGGAGSDLMAAGAGDDFIIGGVAEGIGLPGDSLGPDGSDTLFGGDGDDTLLGAGWEDKNDNNAYDGGEAVVSGSQGNALFGGAGNDLVIGAAGADQLGGGAESDDISGHTGADILWGGQGDGNDTLDGGGGSDTLFGGLGNDVLQGGNGGDQLFGGAGADVIDGGAVGDSLFGGAGDDTLAGGSGGDSFFFANNHGDDVISDFSVSEDTLFLANTVADFTDIQSVQAASSETTVGGQSGLLIDTGGGNSVFLTGVGQSDLTEQNFAL